MEQLMEFEFIGQLAIGLFLSIVFLQSGLDKIFDWKGNKTWLNDHFSKSPLAPFVSSLLGVVTVMEVITGALALCGVVCLFLCSSASCIYYSVLLSLATYLMLIFGQRVAKDYDGAKTIAIYFGVSLFSLLFF